MPSDDPAQFVVPDVLTDSEREIGARKQAMDSVVEEALVEYEEDGDQFCYIEAFQEFLPSFERILAVGKPADALALIEYALELIETNWETINNFHIEMEFLVKDLQNLHHKACQDLKPDPEKLAKHLFEWAAKSKCGAFRNAPKDYASVYGKEGLEVVWNLANRDSIQQSAKKAASKDRSKRDSK